MLGKHVSTPEGLNFDFDQKLTNYLKTYKLVDFFYDRFASSNRDLL